MKRLIGRALAVAVVTPAVVSLGVGVAFADVVVDNGWVRGRADWAWQASRLTNVSMSVRDLVCNGTSGQGFVQLHVFKADGTHVFGTQRFDPDGCGGAVGSWSGLTFTSSNGIAITKVRVRVCEANLTHCKESGDHDNPTT